MCSSTGLSCEYVGTEGEAVAVEYHEACQQCGQNLELKLEPNFSQIKKMAPAKCKHLKGM